MCRSTPMFECGPSRKRLTGGPFSRTAAFPQLFHSFSTAFLQLSHRGYLEHVKASMSIPCLFGLWESCGKAVEKLRKSCGKKAVEKLRKSCGKAAEKKLWKSCRKAVEKLLKKSCGKAAEKLSKSCGKKAVEKLSKSCGKAVEKLVKCW